MYFRRWLEDWKNWVQHVPGGDPSEEELQARMLHAGLDQRLPQSHSLLIFKDNVPNFCSAYIGFQESHPAFVERMLANHFSRVRLLIRVASGYLLYI